MSQLLLNLNSEKKNVLLLALCQVLAMTGNTVLFITAAIVGQALATDKSLATLPLALLPLATMVFTIPASLLMRQIGRQKGFMTGILIGLTGAGLGIYAIVAHSFILFCCATILFGSFNGFAAFYRFAAADVATEEFRSSAIALVVSGGVIAALIGPQLATWSKDWLQSAVFTGSLAAIAILQLISLCLLWLMNLPQPAKNELQIKGRSLFVIIRQPVFIVAVLGSMFGYGVMALVMTATPLAMIAQSHPFHEAATVIQWHMLGMFTPSFFTGFLIARWGVLTIISWGSLITLLSLAINLWGTGLLSFSVALLLLGIGWNFLFIGSSTLLTEVYAPAEKAKTQALHDFLMFGFVAFTTMLSGSVLQNLGWQAVNLSGIPMMLLVLTTVFWLRQQRNKLKAV